MRKERIVLKYGVDAAAIGRNTLCGLAENLDMAGGRLLETGHQPQAGGLAGAGWAEHGEELAGRDFKIDSIDGAHSAEMARDVFEQDGGGHGLAPEVSYASTPNPPPWGRDVTAASGGEAFSFR